MKSAPRAPSSRFSETVVAYARASGRQFSGLMDGLAWGEVELRQLLRNRSGYINVHTEDISRFTDDWQVAYRYPGESAAGD